jgi:hypothetical protein
MNDKDIGFIIGFVVATIIYVAILVVHSHKKESPYDRNVQLEVFYKGEKIVDISGDWWICDGGFIGNDETYIKILDIR